MPEGKIYIPRPFGKNVSIVVGEPIKNLGEVLAEHEAKNSTRHETYKAVTDVVQQEMLKVEAAAKEWHAHRLAFK